MPSSPASEVTVRFEPTGRTIRVLPGTLLLEAAARAGQIIQTPCGGNGTCGKCAVRIVEGRLEPTAVTVHYFSAPQAQKGWRLACQDRVQDDVTIEIPAAARFDSRTKILTTSTGRHLPVKPAVWKQYVEMPLPAQERPEADVERLEAALGRKLRVPLRLVKRLPNLFRENGFKGTAVGRDGELIGFEPGDTSGMLFGVAFDLGTTTIVGTLLELHTGKELAVAAVMNPQVAIGDDVISRISRVREHAVALRDLQERAVGALRMILEDLWSQSGVRQDQIYSLTLAGNSTMQHLLCGITPAALGEIPFAPAHNHALAFRPAEIGLEVNDAAILYVFPSIGSFVGGDTVAGILATNLKGAAKPHLLVDIGTNGEIVLSHNGRLTACSTAAGPAFEGARIHAGMRAADGAIDKFLIADGDLRFSVIGDGTPAGLCGSALIDLIALLLDAGVIDSTGRIQPTDELPANLSPALRARIREDGHAASVLLAPAAASRTGADIVLTQRDVRELQLAAAAIRAGILILLKHAGLTTADLDAVLLAGGFGNFIRRNHALRIGLLPDVPHDRIRFVGNTSLMGAKAALLSLDECREAERLAVETTHIDLSLDPEFQMEFGNAMLFPEPA